MASAVATPLPAAQAGAKLPAGNAESGESVESSADTEEGATPLMYASQQGRDSAVQQMLAAEVGCAMGRDRTGKTALHYCCEQAGPSTAALLLAAAPSLLDAKDQDGYAPLTLAVIAGNRTLVRYLLARGADVNTADAEHHSVVHWATVCGDAASLELVIGAGAAVSTPDLHGGYPIHYAAQLCGPQGAAATVAENGTSVSRSISDRGAGLAVLRTLLAAGASVAVRDHDGRQPLLWAASAGSADAILALVNAGADIEAEDKDGLTALHCAASRGHTDCVETLVSLCGAHVDVIDSNGCTALFYAVTLGHADATRLLLRRGAEPNRQDRKGRTAAHCGAAKGQLETLRILSAHGANLWLRNVRGDFPLHDAVQSGRTHLVQWLLSLKSGSADGNQGTGVLSTSAADATNNDGRTPLHLAALHNNVEICKILLDARCLLNPTMRTNRHQLLTPLDAALLRGNRGCAKFLQLHGGVPASRLTESLGRLRASGRSLPIKQAGSVSPDLSPERSSGQHSRTMQVHTKDDAGTSMVVYQHGTKSAPGSDEDCVNVCSQHVHCCKRSTRGRSQTDVQRWRRRERQAKRRKARYRDVEGSSCSEEEDSDGDRRSAVEMSHKSTLSEGDSPVRARTRTSFVKVGEENYLRYSEGETANRYQDESRSDRPTRRDSSSRRSRRQEKRSRSGRPTHRTNDYETNPKSDTSHNKRRNASVGDADRPVSKNSRRRLKGRENDEKDVSNESTDREQVTKSECDTRVSRVSRDDVPKSGSKRRRDTRRGKRSLSNEREATKETIVSKTTTIQTVARTSEQKEDDGESNAGIDNEVESAKGNRNAEGRSSRNSRGKANSLKVSSAPKTNTTSHIDVKVKSETVLKSEKSASVSKSKPPPTEIEADVEESLPPAENETKSTDEDVDVTPDLTSDKEVATRTLVTAVVHRENVATTSGPSYDDSNEVTEEIDGVKQVDNQDQSTISEQSPPQQELSNETADQIPTQGSEINEEESQTAPPEGELDRSEDVSEQATQSLSVETPSEMIADAEVIEVEPDLSEKVTDELDEPSARKQPADGKSYKCSKCQSDQCHHITSNILQEESPQQETAKKDPHTRLPGGPTQPHRISEQPGKKLVPTLKKSTQKENLRRDTKQPHFESERRVDSKESSLERAKNYAANLRKEKTSSRQAKKNMTSKSRSQYSSKRQMGRTATKTTVVSTTAAPVLPIDVDDEDRQSPELSGRSPNDQLVDSGLEPSPRREDLSDREAQSDASLDEDPQSNRERRRRTHIETTSKFDSVDDAVDGNPKNGEEVSVTRAVQISMRKYHLERRIFHELLELKRLQIRAGRANEQVLVKRLVDDYRRAGLCVGLQQYTGTYTFRSFEKYLYEQLRALQATGQHVVPRLQSSDDLERLMAALRRTRARHGSPPDDPLLCTLSTHRCHHALHAYSGVPCAAYIPKMNHHTIPKDDLENPGAHARAHATSRSRSSVSFLPLIDGRQTEVGRFSRLLDSSRPVTLQLSHGQEKQVISLPTERLDKNKRYYVTFTIKGGSPAASTETYGGDPSAGPASLNATKNAEDTHPQDSQSATSKSQRHGKSF